MRALRSVKARTVLCTHCSGPNEVAAKAMSVFCIHCRKRLILENVTVKSYEAIKDYTTCGNIVVEKRGRIAAPVQAGDLTVKGTVQGTIHARGKVEVTRTGSVFGDVVASALRVQKGARLIGFCRIRPTVLRELETGGDES